MLGLLGQRLLNLRRLLPDVVRDLTLAEYSISSSVTPQMPTSARAISGSNSSRTAGRCSRASALS